MMIMGWEVERIHPIWQGEGVLCSSISQHLGRFRSSFLHACFLPAPSLPSSLPSSTWRENKEVILTRNTAMAATRAATRKAASGDPKARSLSSTHPLISPGGTCLRCHQYQIWMFHVMCDLHWSSMLVSSRQWLPSSLSRSLCFHAFALRRAPLSPVATFLPSVSIALSLHILSLSLSFLFLSLSLRSLFKPAVNNSLSLRSA